MTHDYTKTLAELLAEADELNAAAQNAGIEFWFSLDFHWMTFDMRITKGIGPGCLEIWRGCVMEHLNPGLLSGKMAKAREEIDRYRNDKVSSLEKEVQHLSDKLKSRRDELAALQKED